MEFTLPGVAAAVLAEDGAATFIEPLVTPELDNLIASGPPLVDCRYQKLREYAWPMFNAGDRFWNKALPLPFPPALATKCRLEFPE
jgi:hypothetical protein